MHRASTLAITLTLLLLTSNTPPNTTTPRLQQSQVSLALRSSGAFGQLQPNFTVSVSPLAQTVAIGDKITYGILLTSLNNFAGQVTLEIQNLSAMLLLITGFDPRAVSLQANATAQSTLTVDATAAGEEAYAEFLVVGVSGNLTNQARIAITIVVGGIRATPASIAFLGGLVIFAALVILYGLRSRRTPLAARETSSEPRPPPI